MRAYPAGRLPAIPSSTPVPISWAAAITVTVGLAVLAGPLAGVLGIWALPGFVAAPVLLAVALRPELGAYLYLATTPLIVGIARGPSVPLRPNEILLVLLLGTLFIRMLVDALAGRP